MASNLGALMVPVFLTVGCVGLVMYMFHKEVVTNNASIGAKDVQLTDLVGSLNTLTAEKTSLQEELEQANAANTVLQAEKDQLAAELEVIKGVTEGSVEEVSEANLAEGA